MHLLMSQILSNRNSYVAIYKQNQSNVARLSYVNASHMPYFYSPTCTIDFKCLHSYIQ